jgi:PAS domain-containing protein
MSVATARTRFRCTVAVALSTMLAPAVARADGNIPMAQSAAHFVETLQAAFSREETAALSLVLGIVAFAVTVSILLVRTRRSLDERERQTEEALGELKARVEWAEGLLAANQQVLAVWDPAGDRVDLRCDPGASRDLPHRPGDVLAFGKWLAPDSAGELDHLVDRLRGAGETFNVMLKTRSGGYIEADGRITAGRAVLRLRDLAGQRRELAEIYHRHKQLLREVDCLRTLLGELPMPAWIRDADGRLVWVNPAYARAVGAGDPAQAIESNAALVDDALRPAAAIRPDGDDADYCRVAVVLSGERRVLDLFEAGARDGSAGLAIDVTEIEETRNELARREVAQARTLDSAATGIAVFGADRQPALSAQMIEDFAIARLCQFGNWRKPRIALNTFAPPHVLHQPTLLASTISSLSFHEKSRLQNCHPGQFRRLVLTEIGQAA